MENFKITLTDTSMIIPVEERLIRICFLYYKNVGLIKPVKIFDEVVLETATELYYLVEIPNDLFILLPYVIDGKNSKLLDDLYDNYDSLDDETRECFDKHIEHYLFKKELILSLDKTKSMKNLFYINNYSYIKDNLQAIDCYIEKHSRTGNIGLVNELLLYRNLVYTEKEITEYYEHQEKIKLGLALPSDIDIIHNWTHLQLKDGGIILIGYKGSLEEELIKIPKMLDDGTRISFIDNYKLDPDKDEYLSLEKIDLNKKPYPDFYKDGVLNAFGSNLFIKSPSVYNGYDETFSRVFTNKLFFNRV